MAQIKRRDKVPDELGVEDGTWDEAEGLWIEGGDSRLASAMGVATAVGCPETRCYETLYPCGQRQH